MAKKRVPLTPDKLKWAKNRNVTLKGTPLNHNAAMQARYKKALQTLVREMSQATKKELIKLFESKEGKAFIKQQEESEALDTAVVVKALLVAIDAKKKPTITSSVSRSIQKLQDRFTDLFNKKSTKLAEEMLGEADESSARRLGTSMKELSGGMTLNTSIVPAGMRAVSEAIVEENVALIKSIPEQYFKSISGAVMRSITSANGLQTLVPAIEKIDGVTNRRAKNIALDQTRKAYNAINKQRMVAIGVKQFRWLHSQGGAHPRHSHLKIFNGKTFSFANCIEEQKALGVDNPNDLGLPGVPINCGCRFVPILNFGDD